MKVRHPTVFRAHEVACALQLAGAGQEPSDVLGVRLASCAGAAPDLSPAFTTTAAPLAVSALPDGGDAATSLGRRGAEIHGTR